MLIVTQKFNVIDFVNIIINSLHIVIKSFVVINLHYNFINSILIITIYMHLIYFMDIESHFRVHLCLTNL